ncbi:MAG: patatin-like phospholipase family protein [Hyphomicrobiaceae bacterium]
MNLAPRTMGGLPARTGKPRIGLALGGGGARGLAHLAILEALEEEGFAPAVIAGTSIGAIFGAGAAAGLSARHMRAHVEEVLSERYALVRQLLSVRPRPIDHLFRLLPLRSALLDAEALLEALLPSRLPAMMEGLQVPLAIVATDFYAQDAVVIREGPLRQAVAASIALPVIFGPVVIGGRALLDGGLVDPLPFELVREGADITIAVDVSGAARERTSASGPRALEALLSASQILQRSIIREKLRSSRPDILIDGLSEGVGVLEFHRFREILTAAEAAKDVLKRQLERVLSADTLEPRDGPQR